MTRLGRYAKAVLLAACVVPWTAASAQGDCTNEFLYPENAVTASPVGAVTTIAECSYEAEHARITDVHAVANYEFDSDLGSYITVRQGTYDGPVLGQGSAPLTVTTTSTDDLFVHWNVDDDCTTADDCAITTVQLLLDCTPPQATYSFVEDCDAQNYAILLNITSIGDAASVDVEVDVNGDITTVSDLVVGEVELGPFGLTEIPVIRILHDADVLCNAIINDIDFITSCPLMITCGAAPTAQSYCYQPDEDRGWLYTASGTGTLRLRFLRGTIENSIYDSLQIYDGTDATGTLLWQHDTTTTVNLGPVNSAILNEAPFYEAVDVFSTTGSIFLRVVSEGSVQCGGEFPSDNFDSWEWQVVCLDCTLPEVSYTVTDDCANDQFSVLVDVASTGDGPTVEIIYTINGGEEQTVTGAGTGISELGPFSLNDTIVAYVQAQGDLCSVDLGTITDTGLCPVLVDCGTEVSETTCYENYGDVLYIYRGTGTFPLGIFFDAGQVFYGDTVIVYDGDMNAPRLFEGTEQDLAEVFVYTTNPEHLLTVRVVSDAFTACSDMESEPLAWRVSCLDCVHSTASFDIVPDCANNQFFVSVNLSSLGSDPEAQIINDLNADIVIATEPGTYQVGPFSADTVVVVTVVNDANFLCNVKSDVLVPPVCPVTYECPSETLTDTYCYQGEDSHAWSYELSAVSPTSTLRLRFVRGTIESSTYDQITIYDGPNNTSPVLFTNEATETMHLGEPGSSINDTNGEYPGYYSVDVGSTTGTLYMEVTSDPSVQCGSFAYDEWEWEVYCVDCSNPAATFTVVPDCSRRAYSAEVNVTAVGADAQLSITDLVSGTTISGLGLGVHTVGPFPVDSTSRIRVYNETFEQCRATSEELLYTADECISVTCGFDETTLCYENNDDRWYTYRSAVNAPMTIAFLGGNLPAGDSVMFYNGADEDAAILYEGNNGGLLAGLAINSANASNTITLRVKSDGAASCADQQVGGPLTWTVACGAVGIAETSVGGFLVYPNPTQGLLSIEFGNKITGAVRARVLDMSGRVVLDQPLQMAGSDRNTIDMGSLQSGNYVVQVTTSDWVKTQRVQVAR